MATNFRELIQQLADKFERIIQNDSTDLESLPTEDFGWSNKRWQSKKFRLAHLELFQQPRFSVLHMVIWPHIWDPSAIFGFDIIASDHKSTGLFFDLSPTVGSSQRITGIEWKEPRDKPVWGDIFSDHWIACRPDLDEAIAISELACVELKKYIYNLGMTSSLDILSIIEAQNRYSIGQRQNIHTTKAVENILGKERGKYFVEQILFPTIDD
jgi:Ferredoxin-dependent bilin reductase